MVLAHGLWVSRSVLFAWRVYFKRRGVRTLAFGYPSREPLADNARRLGTMIESLPAKEIYLLGHSLGGVLILQWLAQVLGAGASPPHLRRVVLAGTPASGSESARRLAHWRGGRWLMAGAAPVILPSPLLQRAEASGIAPVEIGVIAGTRGFGLGRVLGPLPGPSDGAVLVAETQFAAARDTILLPLSHSQMLLSARVVAQAHAFFMRGRFDHDNENTGRTR